MPPRLAKAVPPALTTLGPFLSTSPPLPPASFPAASNARRSYQPEPEAAPESSHTPAWSGWTTVRADHFGYHKRTKFWQPPYTYKVHSSNQLQRFIRNKIGGRISQRRAKLRRQNDGSWLYDMAPIVLDLDAEDCPHVRPYDRAEYEKQRAMWQEEPEIDDMVARMRDYRGQLLKIQTAWAQRPKSTESPSQRLITDRDVLAVAFLGFSHPDCAQHIPSSSSGPQIPEPRSGFVTRHHIRSFGIPEQICHDIPLTIRYMLRCLRDQGSLLSESARSQKGPNLTRLLQLYNVQDESDLPGRALTQKT